MEEDPLAGAYEGIMSIRDDPKKKGLRQFCGHTIPKMMSFSHGHSEEMRTFAKAVEDKSEIDSVDLYESYHEDEESIIPPLAGLHDIINGL